MNDFEERSIDILRTFGSNGDIVIQDSGGKDSSVLLHLAMRAGIDFEVTHALTTVDAPETVRFVMNKFDSLNKLGIKATILKPRKSMWKLIEEKKIPPTRLIRYCCGELKENSVKGRKIATGVRAAESRNRRENQGIATFTKPSKSLKEIVDDVNFHQTDKGGWFF